MKPRIFICFRKADSRWARNRVYHELAARFGTEQVFKSGASIPPGADYVDVLTHQAAACELMLVLIGPRWADITDGHGRRMLDNERDWVRLEIGTALRSGNRVLPILLGEATMLPDADELPAELAQLSRLQFLRLEESRFRAGLDELVSVLDALLPDLGGSGADGAGGVGAAGGAPQASAAPARQQHAHVRDGGVAVNIGGNVTGGDVRIIGRDDRSRAGTA
ncbi:MAG: toll/interleukin-1 receptor domain-containing protein [Catenulispora sp.]